LVTIVAIQDRRRLVCSGLELLIDGQAELELAGCAKDDAEMRTLVLDYALDVVALEIRSEDWDVAELVAFIRRQLPDVRLIGLHHGRRSDHVAAGRAVGVDMLHPYGTGTEQLFAALRWQRVLPSDAPKVDRRVLPGRGILTARECEVLRHISAGLTTQQSAEVLEVSPKTIDNHKQRMFGKLGVQNQAHAVAVAHRAGILRSSSEAADA
jgi:DNA-binding NarL/FixJ family response regulator